MDAWFGPPKSAPPRWKQAFSIWVVYCPSLMLFNIVFQEQLASLSLFWRVVVTTSAMSPILSFFLIPFISRVLHGWLHRGTRRLPAPACCGRARVKPDGHAAGAWDCRDVRPAAARARWR